MEKPLSLCKIHTSILEKEKLLRGERQCIAPFFLREKLIIFVDFIHYFVLIFNFLLLSLMIMLIIVLTRGRRLWKNIQNRK
ncbi:hypothetical protein CNQ82_10350 [Staphylococcus debuckii]|nr:hypothetical protein CNQ82_10350 [Staphylococcus debuckii]